MWRPTQITQMFVNHFFQLANRETPKNLVQSEYEYSLFGYGDSHVKDKTVARPSYLSHGDPYTGKAIFLYWDGPLLPWSFVRGTICQWPVNSLHKGAVMRKASPSHEVTMIASEAIYSLQWCNNKHDGVSRHQPHGCLLNRLFKALINENIEAPRHWPLRGEFTGHWWIPRTKGQ